MKVRYTWQSNINHAVVTIMVPYVHVILVTIMVPYVHVRLVCCLM